MRLVGGVVGAVIGAYFGNPYAGYAIGSMIGGALEPPQKFKQEGPRLTDLKVTNSSYSIGKPKVFGTYRMSGNLIFSTALKETKNVETQEQGKGGGGAETETTTYTYRVTCAYALCEGIISGVRRIWWEGKLVYDYSQNNNGFIGNIGGNIKVYLGTETQLPDPSIEAELGVGEVPGYRGTAYVVFTDMQLQEFQNRIPNFTFEVVRSPDNINTGKFDKFSTSSTINDKITGWLQYNNNNRFIYANLESGTSTGLYKIDPYNNTIVASNTTLLGNASYNDFVKSKKINILQNGDLVIGGKTVSGYGTGWYIIDQDSLEVKQIIDYRNFSGTSWVDSGGYTGASFRAPPNMQNYKDGDFDHYISMSIDATKKFQFFDFISSGLGLTLNKFSLATSDTTIVGGSVQSSLVYGNLFITDGVNQKCYWTISTTNYQGTGNRGLVLSCYDMKTDTVTDNFKLLKTEFMSSGNYYVNDMYFDKITRCIFILYNNNSINRSYFMRYNIDTDTIISDILITDGAGNYPNLTGTNKSIGYDSTFRRLYFPFSVVISSVTRYFIYYLKVDTGDYQILETTNNSSWLTEQVGDCNSAYATQLGCEFYMNSNSSNSYILKNYGPRLTMGTYPLDQCVLEIIKDSKIDLSKVDVTELSSDIVYGFCIPNSSAIRACLEQLATAYNFQMVESDYKLKFRKNGSNSVKTIKVTELSAVNYSPDIKFETDITTESKMELELPQMVNVTYADIDRDYQNNTQESKYENVETNEIQNIELPMVFNADQAKQIADRLLYQQWINRYTYTFSTNYDYIELEPCDVINVVSNTENFTMKLIKKEKGGGIIKWTAVAEDSAVFTQINSGSTGGDISQQIPVISTSKLFWLDLPILQNSDDNPGVYVASNRQNSSLSWTGSTVFVSDQSNGNYVEQASFFNEVTSGTSLTKLDDFTVAYDPIQNTYNNIGDYLNSVTIKMFRGTLSSITDDQLDQGYNLCCIGNEVLQFKNATLIGTDTYKLDTFYRGRFGTEQFIGTHQVGDQFVILNSSSKTIQRILKDQSQLNIARYFKNVSFKDTLLNTQYTQFINTGVGLKPYSVNNIQAIRTTSGDLNVKFNKRVRGFAPMVDYKDVYDPDGDYYQIDIYSDNTFTTIKRTLSVNATTFVYSSTDQTADFGSTQSTIYMIIYKTNKIIGRGYGAKAIL